MSQNESEIEYQLFREPTSSYYKVSIFSENIKNIFKRILIFRHLAKHGLSTYRLIFSNEATLHGNHKASNSLFQKNSKNQLTFHQGA